MPNELCGTCQKPKCPSECVPNLGGKYCSNGMSMVNRCHGIHPDDSGKVCQRCGQEGKHFCPVLAEEIKQATKEEHDKGYHSSPEPSCPSCSPSTKSEGKCWACEKRGRLCEKHAEAYIPTPCDKDGENWEVEFDKLLDKAPTPLGIKSFIRSHLQHQRILGRREQWEKCAEVVKATFFPADNLKAKEAALSAIQSVSPDAPKDLS